MNSNEMKKTRNIDNESISDNPNDTTEQSVTAQGNLSGEQTTEKPPVPTITMRSGNTTYVIGLHFKQDGKETMNDKVKRLIKRDIKEGNY